MSIRRYCVCLRRSRRRAKADGTVYPDLGRHEGLGLSSSRRPEKLPTTVLVEQPLALLAVNCSVVGTRRSVPLLFNTVNGNENLATIWPLLKFWLFRKGRRRGNRQCLGR